MQGWNKNHIETLKKKGKIKGHTAFVKQCDVFNEKPVRKKKSNLEFQLQCECIKYFDGMYPEFTPLLFHVTNQAVIDSAKIGGMLKALGRRRGIWDAKLQVPRNEWWGLWIEFKVEDGELSPEQVQFKKLSDETGCKYKWVVIRNRFQFAKVIEGYLQTGRVIF